MADANYDAVFVGGGGNALVTALYLARNGMKVGVFDRRHEIGGEFCTDEFPLPGFLMNTCATFIRFYLCPAVWDFKLSEYGLKFVMPEPSNSCIFDDDTALVIWPTSRIDVDTGKVTHLSENVERNLKQIAKFSEKDAETTMRWSERFIKGMGEKVNKWYYNPPPPPWEKDLDEEMVESGEIDPRWPKASIGELAYELYESDALRIYFMRLAQGHVGCYPDQVQHLLFNLHQIGSMAGGMPISIVFGGTHQIAHALQRALSSRGGHFFVNSKVDKILIKDGKATGIRLVDGTEIAAKQLVVSSADPWQMAFNLLDPELTTEEVKNKIRNLQGDNYGVIWASVALDELPKYKAAASEPHCMTQRCYLLPKDADYFRFKKMDECRQRGIPSKFLFHMTHDTAWVPSFAPPGKHDLLIEEYTAPDKNFSRQKWEEIRQEVPGALLKWWQRFAPNMTEDKVIGVHVILGVDLVDRWEIPQWSGIAHSVDQLGKMRPIPEWSGYRVPNIQNLYLTGQFQHPGGSSWGLPGYNCYKVIAKDLGLEKVWEKAGRPF
jgi:phytoene dehydrogenase-like protein